MAHYNGPIIDIDVHHRPRDEAELVNYLPLEWRDYGEACVRNGLPMRPIRTGVIVSTEGGMRADSYPEDGSPPGADYELTCSQLLDRFGISKAILGFNNGEYGMHSNQYFAAALCRAANDWNLDRWLSRRDDRLYSSLVVSPTLPEEAAKEIRRLGDDPRMADVLLGGNGLSRPLGDPLYHPIYEAAAEVGLPIATHPTGASDFVNTTGAAGIKATAIEAFTCAGPQASTYIASMIVHGVFEKFPDLKFIVKEYGLSWLPSLMWNLDEAYDLLRRESPWVKRPPSEYIIEHVRLSTQPLEAGEDTDSLSQLLSTIPGVERILCFSTDYPHFSMDDPTYVARHIPASWHSRVFYENACEAYGWDIPPEREAQALLSATDA